MVSDFIHEAKNVKSRLLERGYSHRCLKKAFNRVVNKNKHDLLFSHKRDIPTSNEYTRIITTFSNKHIQVKQIFNKYQHILVSDPTIGSFVPPTPLITFRHTSSVGNLLVKSEFKGSTQGDPCNTLGTFPCGACGYCHFMDTSKNPQLPNGWIFFPQTLR